MPSFYNKDMESWAVKRECLSMNPSTPCPATVWGETKHKIVGAHYTIHVHTTKLSHVSRSTDLTLNSDKREIKGEIIEGSFLK